MPWWYGENKKVREEKENSLSFCTGMGGSTGPLDCRSKRCTGGMRLDAPSQEAGVGDLHLRSLVIARPGEFQHYYFKESSGAFF